MCVVELYIVIESLLSGTRLKKINFFLYSTYKLL